MHEREKKLYSMFIFCTFPCFILIRVCYFFNYLGRCCPFYNEKLGRVMEDFNNMCPECPFQYKSDQSVIKCVKTGIKYHLSEQKTDDNMSTITNNVIFGDNNTEHGKEKDEEPITFVLLPVAGIIILVLVITSIYRFRHCFTSVCDRLKVNTDKQGSLKPQLIDLMASGSSEPMIKKEGCAKSNTHEFYAKKLCNFDTNSRRISCS